MDLLLDTYPEDHEVILYECAVLPIEEVREDRMALKDLAQQPVNLKTTLVIPPKHEKIANKAMLETALKLADKFNQY